jgi:hypothetical protein
MVELPDGSACHIPVSWTDQAEPDPTQLADTVKNLRLSPYALLEIYEWFKKQDEL